MVQPLSGWRQRCPRSVGVPRPALSRSGGPPPLLAPPRSLWSRPRRVAGASGDRLSGSALPFFFGWRPRGLSERLVAWLPRPRGVVCPHSRARRGFSPFGSLSPRARSFRAPSPLASVAFSLRSPAPPVSPPLARAPTCANSKSTFKIYRAILYRTMYDFDFDFKLSNARRLKLSSWCSAPLTHPPPKKGKGGVHCHTPQTPLASVFHGFDCYRSVKNTK